MQKMHSDSEKRYVAIVIIVCSYVMNNLHITTFAKNTLIYYDKLYLYSYAYIVTTNIAFKLLASLLFQSYREFIYVV